MINNLKSTSVSSGYKLGLSHREAIPFRTGSEYKIKECRGGLERTQNSLTDIGEAIRKKDMPHSFGPCMGFEAAAWYWHFVDVVWLFLFFAVYMWGI